MNPIVTAYGEVLWDLLPDGPVLGGAPFNFVYRAKSLGADAELISRLGTDEFGNAAADKIIDLGFDLRYIQTDGNKPSGTVPVSFDEYKNPSYIITPDVAYDYIENSNLLRQRISISDCLCFGSLIQRSQISKQTLYDLFERFEGKYLLYDINLRKECYTYEIVEISLKKCHIVKLNEDEIFELKSMLNLKGDTIQELAVNCVKEYSLKYCLVTLGDKGIFAVSDAGETVYVPGLAVKLVDPLGAGDACSAGFIYSLLTERPLEHACKYANALGAAVAETSGATVPVSIGEIEKKLHEGAYTSAHPEFA